MVRSSLATVATCLVLLSSSITAAAAGQPAGASPERALLDRYCVSCHNDNLRTAGLALDTMDLANVGDGAAVWEKVVTKLRAGMMPPAGRPRPDQASYSSLTSYLETELDRAAASNPDPGRSDALRRLNGTEYRNAIRDLLHLDIDVTALLPADDSSAGFDNVSLGGLDPGRLERYLTAARKISRLAVGAEVRSAVADTFIVPSDLNQTGHIEGLPFGTRGGSTVRYNFPVDAEYELRVELGKSWNSNSVGGLRAPQDVVITVDGEPVTVLTVTRPQRRRRPPAQQQPPQQPQQNQQQQAQREQQQQAVSQFLYQPGGKAADADLFVRLRVMAGPRTVGAAFVSQGFQLLERHRQPFQKIHITVGGDQRAEPNVYSITITGPFDATGPGDTPSRRRIFSCRPTDASQAAEVGCAQEILATLARRAYRRPVTDTDVALLLRFYREGREVGDFEAGIEMALRRLLVSPEFLFRVERDPLDEAEASRPYLISDLELASRLSFFLWASIPDDELIDVAANGTLRDPGVLQSQVRRMLADPRADTLVTNFAAQWLYLRNLPAVSPNFIAFPDFDDTLRRAMRQETELFFGSIIHEDRSVLDLLTADYTFLNERLAKHYDIPNIYGSHFRRITLPPNSPRGGLLGQGSILAVTAYATRTSPVVRGKWILENLLGTPPPPPPPNVPPLSEDKSDAVLSMRERMVEHRRNPVCASCHAIMDPVGLSLENFDAVGRWRTLTDGFAPIDASGSFPDGTTFDGVSGLKQAILGRSDQFVRTLTGKLLTYALGRAMEYYDAPAIRAIERTAARDDYRFSSLILGIVKSTPFQMRRPHSPTTVAAR
ncbi:MAG: DUF1592 domain-containing protein [Acidobacteria bacterium]|nr:DUF1592 domain-containing protein [Acidobacteriota bacterium]